MRKKFLPYGTQDIDEADINSVARALGSPLITTGPIVEEFEKEICQYIGCDYAVAVSSGTAALDIAVGAIGAKGGEIITTPFTFVATANSILFNNLKPVFVDIEKDTFNINPKKVEEKINENTKAITCVDFAGHPAQLDELKKICQENSLILIEDACHALGSSYKGMKVGNISDMTCFSLHPVKHITSGEGGIVTTNNSGFYKRLLLLRNHGMDKESSQREREHSYKYDVKLLGKNYRITDFQCALAMSQLKKLDGFIKRREEIVKKYNEHFAAISEIRTPIAKDYAKVAWHLYTILLDKKINRDVFFQNLRKRKIGANVHYIPVYKHSYYKNNFKFNEKEFPVTEDVFSRILTLPLFPKMTDEDVNDVIEAVRELIKVKS